VESAPVRYIKSKKMRQLIAVTALLFTLSTGCSNGAKDEKNAIEPYPNTDTTQRMENLNNQHSDSAQNAIPSNKGDIQ
jgi:hypothetical protein